MLLNRTQVGLAVGPYDRHRPLIVDPVLAYATFLGGSGQDFAECIAVDRAGDAYVVGQTRTYDFPTTTHALSLQAALRQDMSIAGAIALVVFFAFAMQCTSTLAVVRRETNSLRWPVIQFCYMGTLAYIAALLTNQVLSRLL